MTPAPCSSPGQIQKKNDKNDMEQTGLRHQKGLSSDSDYLNVKPRWPPEVAGARSMESERSGLTAEPQTTFPVWPRPTSTQTFSYLVHLRPPHTSRLTCRGRLPNKPRLSAPLIWQHDVAVRSTGSGINLFMLKSQLCHSWAVWPWASHLTSLGLISPYLPPRIVVIKWAKHWKVLS